MIYSYNESVRLQQIDQSVRASEWNSVVVGSNPTQTNFL